MNNNLYMLCCLMCILILPFKGTAQKSLNQETIFIVFEGSKFEKHKQKRNDVNILGEYFFLVPDHPEDPSGLYNKGLITLVDKKYKDFDAKFSDDPLPRFRINKSFLRKNKDQILSVKKMRHLGFNKIFRMLTQAKHIFLIDKLETKDQLITIKQVEHFYVGEE